jgi:O-succinylbenzoate synthase
MNEQVKICAFDIEKYSREFTFGGKREGLYIHLADTDGNKSSGEIAPLPGRSLETLEQAYDHIKKIRKNFLDGNFIPFNLHPSVMFGMQMALYKLQNKTTLVDTPVTKLFFSPPILNVSGRVKLKLGNFDIDEAISFYNKFKGKEKNITIDLERKWDLDKSVAFCEKIDTCSILYIEDPTTNYSDLERFFEKTNVEFAVDMFLIFQPLERIKVLKGLNSITLKPTLVGGIHECRLFQQDCLNIPIVLSSLFETEVGIEDIKLISSLLCPNKPAGVDTLKFLKKA